MIQIGIILFAVRFGGLAAQRLRIPTVIGELLAGILIGPFALGGIPVPFFKNGIFAAGATAGLPVSLELHSIATIASIILLFVSGLETDLALFLKYSVAGGVVGIGGVLASFSSGDFLGMYLWGGGFMSPVNLFMGILSTATSVGITARILSDRKKMDSPEGVTILAAAVFDDVLGIICLAVVMGITAISTAHGDGHVDWHRIGIIASRAFGFWLGFTVLGFILANRIAKFLKRFKQPGAFSMLALGLALIISGFFEMEGLAMIIGAYIIGLSLSKTDISHIIIEKVHGLYEFFVPIFFAVMGMLVDIRQLLSKPVIVGGLLFTVTAILAKVIGCGLPALFSGFNYKGALRIGVGMVPRGEVALIIAGIGYSAGILDAKIFGISILMTLLTTLIAPTGLSAALSIPGDGTVEGTGGTESQTVEFDFPSEDVAVMVTDTMLHQLQSEGFYVQMMDIQEGIAQVRKETSAFSLRQEGPHLAMQANSMTVPIVKTAVFEAVASLNQCFHELHKNFDPARVRREIGSEAVEPGKKILKVIVPSCIITDLNSQNKNEVIIELLDALDRAGKISDRALAEKDVFDRERSMSTGLEDGVATPHAKTDAVTSMVAAIGVKASGIEFDALDGKPSKIFVLSLTPKKSPESHIQFLAGISGVLRNRDKRRGIIEAQTPVEVSRILGI